MIMKKILTSPIAALFGLFGTTAIVTGVITATSHNVFIGVGFWTLALAYRK